MSTYIEYIHSRPDNAEVLCKLASAVHFTAADLEANRKGTVGQEQLRYHLHALLSEPLLLLLAGLTVSFMVRVAYAGYVEHQNIFTYVGELVLNVLGLNVDKARDAYFMSNGKHLPILVMAFVVSAPGVAYRKLRQIPFRIVRDLLRGKVLMIEGAPTVTSEEVKAPGRAGAKGETITKHYYQLKDLKLNVTSEAYKALSAGLRYRIYYLPESNTLISLEPLLA